MSGITNLLSLFFCLGLKFIGRQLVMPDTTEGSKKRHRHKMTVGYYSALLLIIFLHVA